MFVLTCFRWGLHLRIYAVVVEALFVIDWGDLAYVSFCS